ncbi:cytochrome b/b6 domain-containing protein [Pseudooceanicola sp. 200-1SW]|uniref:cytochrome b/b6 domain-containing protein n=1 Tax=Pseudooceanicola sp. 200-1SW TaxID=3425949 RepID=UPI003D7F9507
MPLSDSPAHYGAVTRAIHWLTALLILLAWPLGLYAHALAEEIPQLTGAEQAAQVSLTATLFSVHKTMGVAVVLVSILRLLWAWVQRRPDLLNGEHRTEALAAETVHLLLYVLLIAVPVTGWIHHAATAGFAPILWPFGQSLPFVPQSESVAALFTTLHWALAWMLAAVLALHVAGALKHHVIDRDATLRRMLRGTPAPGSAAQPGHALPAAAALALLLAVMGAGLALRPAAPHAAPGTEAIAAPTLEASAGGEWQVTEGTLSLSVTQFGNVVEGQFADWTAQIDWNEDAAPGVAGHVTVTVAIPSLTLGSVTSQALGGDFLAAEDHPTAIFDADLVKLPEGGQRAEGTLTLRGQTMPLAFPFELAIEDDTATASASFTLDRRDFGVGAGMTDESSVAFAVSGGFELSATRD